MGAFQIEVKTDKDTHFTGALVTNAAENENVVLAPALAGVGGNARAQLRSIAIISDQNLDWEVMLFRKDTFGTSDLDTDSFVGRWTFAAADAVRIAGAGSYYYYIDGLDEAYTDEDASGELHVTLLNRNAVAKNAGATGEIVVKLRFEPPQFGF